jgi:hypothetical protein
MPALSARPPRPRCCPAASALPAKPPVGTPPSAWRVFFEFRLLFAALFSTTFGGRGLFPLDWDKPFPSAFGTAPSGAAALGRGPRAGEAGTAAVALLTAFLVAITSHAP